MLLYTNVEKNLQKISKCKQTGPQNQFKMVSNQNSIYSPRPNLKKLFDEINKFPCKYGLKSSGT